NNAGQCMVDDFRLEYQVIHLEYVLGKLLVIEAVCRNPYATALLDKEATFKHTTTKPLPFADEKTRIALLIVESVIKNLELPREKLRKLVIRGGQVFFVCKV